MGTYYEEMKKVIILRKKRDTCDNEVLRSTSLHYRNKLNILTLKLPIYYMQYLNRKSQLVQMCALQKRSETNRLPLWERVGCNAFCFG